MALPVLAGKVLRKLRYLASRLLLRSLQAAWYVLLSPLTFPARVLLAVNRVDAGLRLANRAYRRNPFTPGLAHLLVLLHSAKGDWTSAATHAQAWARANDRWDEPTFRAWSEHVLRSPGWRPVIDLPTPEGECAGELDLRNLEVPRDLWRSCRAAGTLWDALATQLAASQRPTPATVMVDDTLAARAIAAAFSEWCGAEVVTR